MDAAWQDSMSSVLALSIGGVSAMLGLWVGRDKTRPGSFAFAMTLLIGSAVAVGIVQSVLDSQDAIAKRADLDRMIDTVSEIAMAAGDKELAALIEAQTGNKLEVPEPEPEPVVADTGAPAEGAAEGAPADAAPVDGAPPPSPPPAAPPSGTAAPAAGK